MNPSDPLANLQPLREPELIGWWPLAPGWWLVLLTATIAIASLAVWFYRYWQRNAYRRTALRQLEELKALHTGGAAPVSYLRSINALLKSVAVIAYGKRQVAAQHGAQWLAFLERTASTKTEFAPEFATVIYQHNAIRPDTEQLYEAAASWIKHHKVDR